MPLSVVILAAGQGKRMHSDRPKVLQPLAGEPLLAHVIRAARALEPAHLYVVYGHGGAEVQQAFAADHDLEWVLQADQLGTGHAVMQAMCLIPDEHTVLVLYGDVPLIGSACLVQLVDAARQGSLALLTVNLDEASGYGRIVRDAQGRVTAIVEHQDADPEQLRLREAYSGLLAAPADRLEEWLLGLGSGNAAREYYLTDVVAGAVRAGHPVVAIAVPTSEEVLGVNDRRQLAQAETAMRRRRTEALMLAGATLADPARVDVRGAVTVEPDVFIDVNAVLIGRVHLAARVRVGPNCVIRDSQLGADTEIQAHCVIEESTVAENCRIGPFARLRPGTALGPGAHAGNFVELKNATVGAGSKVNHLSYIGDATVGSAVNIGAGTITCNYDGANKWPTVIDDGAFVGSGSMLVAPVRIGAGATIGAGSTITADAAAQRLTLARARQITVEGWRRPEKSSKR
jgi:bifunctional UDP-N-acetylglucosamine pyrophosphorylase/glucosamine-1-phosphate N-acetyltransferase